MSEVVFENPLNINGRFIGGFDIGIKLPNNPRKRIKVYVMHCNSLHAFLDLVLSFEPKELNSFVRLNSKWFTELMIIMPNQLPERMFEDIHLLASRVPEFHTKWMLLGYSSTPLDLPF